MLFRSNISLEKRLHRYVLLDRPDRLFGLDEGERVVDAVRAVRLRVLLQHPPVPLIELIKWRQIYQLIEDSLDSCENVANILEAVVLKFA